MQQIIDTLEKAGVVPPGLLRRSTLSQHLVRAGYSRRLMLRKRRATFGALKRPTATTAGRATCVIS